MTLQNQVKTWIILFAATVIILWAFRGILLPFVVGLALAYLLDPITDKLETWKFSRFWATALVMLIVSTLVIGSFFLFVPLVAQQIVGLADRLPGYIAQLQVLANQWAPQFYAYIGESRVEQLENGMSDLTGKGLSIAGNLLAQIMQSGLTFINALGLLIVTPVVAFYMLLDWDSMVASINKLLPRKHQEEIRGVLKDIDKAMAGVVRGQVSVVLILSVFYATALTLTGLSFGLAIGLISGLLSFIPYVGFLVGLVLSVGVALVQFWPDWIMVLIVFIIFMVGQFLEGNILYPKLVGSSIGVHPVWLMFSLFCFGLIFGFVGLLLAVPLVAIGGVLVRFAVQKYQESPLYLGTNTGKDVANSKSKS